MELKTKTGTPLDGGKKREEIASMFSSVAARYDLLNALISFGLHHAWRRRAVAASGAISGTKALDLCCGTGDFVATFAPVVGSDGFVCGLDYCAEMLDAGRDKLKRKTGCLRLVRGDASVLPFPEASFDVVSIGFGIRNIERPENCLAEMLRVLKPGGRAVILEGGWPKNPLVAAGFSIFARFAIPFLGKLLSGNFSAYRYLPESMRVFPAREKFLAMMATAGFQSLSYIPLGMGSVFIYIGHKS